MQSDLANEFKGAQARPAKGWDGSVIWKWEGKYTNRGDWEMRNRCIGGCGVILQGTH